MRFIGCWFGLAQILHKRLQAAAETVGRLGQAMLVMCDGLRGYLLMRIVMERDYRITGKFRGQSDAVEAPVGFEGWQTYLFIFMKR